MVKIEVCERLMDHWVDHANNGRIKPKYHAQVEGEPGIWACGKSVDEAVGNLVRIHSERFSIELANMGKLAR